MNSIQSNSSLNNRELVFTPEFYLVMVNNTRTIQGNSHHFLLSKMAAFQVFLS